MLIALSTNSCLSSGSQGTNSELTSSSQFMISEVTGSSDVETINPTWKIPSSRVFTFRTCLLDTVTKVSIALQNFEVLKKYVDVEGGEREEIVSSEPTDIFGCITWKERIDYPSMNHAAFLTFERTIRGASLYPQGQTIPLAINPWVKDRHLREKEVRDLRPNFNPLSKDARTFDLGKLENLKKLYDAKSSISIPEVHLENLRPILNGKSTPKVSLKLLFHPKLETTDSFQEKMSLNLKNGKAKINLYLFSSTPYKKQVENNLQLLVFDQKEAAIQNGIFNVNMEAYLINNCEKSGILHLFLEVIPEETAYLPDFSGFYALNGTLCGSEIPAKISASIERDSKNIYPSKKQFYSIVQDQLKEAKEAKEAVKRKRSDFFYIQPSNATRVGTLQEYPYCDINTHRTIQYNVQAVIRDKFFHRKMANQKFIVRQVPIGNEAVYTEEQSRQTDTEGNLVWTGQVTHEFYIKQRYLPQRFILELQEEKKEPTEVNGEAETQNPPSRMKISQVTELKFNPWNIWVRYQDPRARDIKTNRYPMDGKKRLPNEIALHKVQYKTFGYDYTIDPYMNLVIIRNFQVSFQPLSKIRSDIVSGNDVYPRDFRDGHYVVESAIYNKSRVFGEKVLEMIDNYKTVAKSTAGMLRTTIRHKIRDARFMRSRSLWFLEFNHRKLTPIEERMDKNCEPKQDIPVEKYQHENLISHTFVTPIILARETDNFIPISTKDLKINLEYLPSDEVKREIVQELLDDNIAPSDINPNDNATLDSSFIRDWRGTSETVKIADLKKWEEKIHQNQKQNMDLISTPQSFAEFYQVDYINLKNPEESNFSAPPQTLTLAKAIMDNEPDLDKNLMPEICSNILYSENQQVLEGLEEDIKEMISPHIETHTSSGFKIIEPDSIPMWMAAIISSYPPNAIPIGFYPLLATNRDFSIHPEKYIKNKTKKWCNQFKKAHLSIKTKYRIYEVNNIKWNQSYTINLSNDIRFQAHLNNGATTRVCANGGFRSAVKLGFKVPVISPLEFGVDGSADVGANHSRCQTIAANQANSEGSSVHNMLGLMKSFVTFDALQYQECKYISIKDLEEFYRLHLKPFEEIKKRRTLSLQQKIDQKIHSALFDSFKDWQGLFICSGEINTKPKTLIENFGYVSQYFTHLSDMADQANLVNQPWLLPLRGQEDIDSFLEWIQLFGRILNTEDIRGLEDQDLDIFTIPSLSTLRKNMTSIKNAIKDHHVLDEASNRLKDPNKEGFLNHLEETYKDIDKKLPAYPGFYSLPEDPEDKEPKEPIEPDPDF